ncbi:uncharacterized protein MELLADRAFT_104763 [Melampsora larici-populina 98AG31]|uniref:Major facilitator superfamily (MFS) profile domain-containing protein n=1 Tax=Melampsora larici-populina (strain 98AG31 / pathotype 3-4-7) TaxID=747676 RepID=F4RFU0_MELLP|nr:uncharacterized protein MELLADRAFT_104763 [Melampsora larici-populina 98AG31]EGG08871.1 hypothetical protein MELLADRAFT_104763 [Melampsora larici-populina 98AG31]
MTVHAVKQLWLRVTYVNSVALIASSASDLWSQHNHTATFRGLIGKTAVNSSISTNAGELVSLWSSMPNPRLDVDDLSSKPRVTPISSNHPKTPSTSNRDNMSPTSLRFWNRTPTHPTIEITRLTSPTPNERITLVRRPNTAGTMESEAKTVVDAEVGWEKEKVEDVFEPDEENQYRALLNRLDIRILPLTALLYLSAYLNRGNLGNALLYHLRDDALGNRDLHYSLVLCSFFFTYIIFSIPGTLLSKVILPSTSMSIGVLIWSLASSSMAACHTYWQLMICRAFIGVGEALFGQSVVLYYSLWFRRGEMSKRMALFIGSAVVAGAFGGLIAYGVGHIETPMSNWRILFLAEGGPSILLAFLCFRYLPSRPDRSSYLNPKQTHLLQTRINEESATTGVVENGIDWSGVADAFKDPRVYASSLIYSCMNLNLASVSGFLPRIVASLGFSDVQAQLLTVPPYAIAFAVMLPTAIASDHYGVRGPFVVFVFACSSVGWALLLLTHDHQIGVKYAATIFIVIGGYCAVPLMLSWVANNCSSQSKRATSLGMLNSFGQALSVVAAFLFPDRTGPAWTLGCAINLGAGLTAGTVAGLLSLYYAHQRRTPSGFGYIA